MEDFQVNPVWLQPLLWIITAIFVVAGLIMEEIIPSRKKGIWNPDPKFKSWGMFFLVIGIISLAAALYFQFKILSLLMIAIIFLVLLILTEVWQKHLKPPGGDEKIVRYGILQFFLGIIFLGSASWLVKTIIPPWFGLDWSWLIAIIVFIVLTILAPQFFWMNSREENYLDEGYDI